MEKSILPFVKTHIFDFDIVAYLEHILDLFDSLRSDFGDVNHSLFAGGVFYNDRTP